jgi:intracellular septation protein
MKFLFDLFPVILFFAAFKWGDKNPQAAHDLASQYFAGMMAGGTISAEQAPVLLATAAVIVASFAQIGYLLARRKKVDIMLWVSLAVIVILGGLTIYFNDKKFILIKPTMLYWCFAAVLLGGRVIFKKNLIRGTLGQQIVLPDVVWQRLNVAWIAFFVAMGAINLFVAFVLFKDNFAAWVNFKVFGSYGLIFAFAVGQAMFLGKYLEEPK